MPPTRGEDEDEDEDEGGAHIAAALYHWPSQPPPPLLSSLEGLSPAAVAHEVTLGPTR